MCVPFGLNLCQDIAMKVVAFTQQGPRAICILSATGAVSTVMLRQGNNPNGTVKFEVYHFLPL